MIRFFGNGNWDRDDRDDYEDDPNKWKKTKVVQPSHKGEQKMATKTFYIKCTHLFKTKEAALTAGISPWDMWEVTKDDATDAVTMVAPVQVGPIIPPPNEGCDLPGDNVEIHPPWREGARRARRKK